MDCHSPGQGLMPASFKVKAVPLEGRNGEFEDVLDPDFGESAIGRVAPVDSGKVAVAMKLIHQKFFKMYIDSTFVLFAAAS